MSYATTILGKPREHGTDKGLWTTLDELNFIRQLGRWSTRETGDRASWMRGYLETAKARTRWGKVDPAACKGLAIHLLDEAERTAPR